MFSRWRIDASGGGGTLVAEHREARAVLEELGCFESSMMSACLVIAQNGS